jgi:coenzyme F420-reducing hydrogenase delta subunit
MMHASERAGEFIESLGKTDMAGWSREQWGQFIEVICTGYVDKLVNLRAGITTAMDKVSVG